ncbi:MAG: DUF4198 domain-containing protein [Pyrinomonadaceae bacterium]
MIAIVGIIGGNFYGIALAAVSVSLLLAHNLWLVAKNKTIADDERLRIEINTSDHFPVSESAVKPERIADFRCFSSDGSVAITEHRVENQSLVAHVKRNRQCLVALALYPHPINLDAEKFRAYISEEEASAEVCERLPAEGAPQRESYTKYAKALVKGENGSGEIFRRVVGHKLEIIPEQNPCDLGGSGRLPVQVLFDGAPLAGLRVSSGCEQLNEGGYAAHTRTDGDGRAMVELTASGYWFIRTHFIRSHPDARIADWESFWASLTFQVNV